MASFLALTSSANLTASTAEACFARSFSASAWTVHTKDPLAVDHVYRDASRRTWFVRFGVLFESRDKVVKLLLPLEPPLQTPFLQLGIVFLEEFLVCRLHPSYESRAASDNGTAAIILLAIW
jgi:hypothetical protein